MVAVAMADSIFSTGNYQKFREEVWDHSISCGVIAQHLAVDFGHKEEKDTVLVVGLLSDLGKIVLNTINRTKYIEVLTEFRAKGGDILEIERKHFQIDSAEIGPAAAEQWKLPANVIELMKGQTLRAQEQSRGARLVGFAGLIARKTGHGRYVPEKMDSLLDEYFNLFNIYSEDRERFIAECEHRLLKDELYQFCQHL
jgi:HD-like signal output (HDOD) protein